MEGKKKTNLQEELLWAWHHWLDFFPDFGLKRFQFYSFMYQVWLRNLFIHLKKNKHLNFRTCSHRQDEVSPPLEKKRWKPYKWISNKQKHVKNRGWVNWATKRLSFLNAPTASLEIFNFPSSACLPSFRKLCCRFSTRFPHSEDASLFSRSSSV